MKVKVGKRVFDVEDGAKFLKVHQNMIYRYVMAGKLIPLQRKEKRHGDQLFFSLKDLKAFQRPKKGHPSNLRRR